MRKCQGFLCLSVRNRGEDATDSKIMLAFAFSCTQALSLCLVLALPSVARSLFAPPIPLIHFFAVHYSLLVCLHDLVGFSVSTLYVSVSVRI